MTEIRTMINLGPAARQVRTLVDRVRDDQLGAPTPCAEYTVRDLLSHLLGLTVAFRDAARKTSPAGEGADVQIDADGAWRDRLAEQLDALVAAWREPDAWEGMTEAGGVTLPGEMAAKVAADELVLHSWDLARATGQPFEPDPAGLAAVVEFTSLMAEEDEAARAGLFGPVVEVGPDESVFHRALGLSGRDPAWTP